MKKTLIVISLFIAGTLLTAFAINKSKKNTTIVEETKIEKSTKKPKTLDDFFIKKEHDFHISVGTRFSNVATLEDIQNAKSIEDFIPEKESNQVAKYKSVKITILDDYKITDMFAISKDDILTDEQLALLQTLDYSSNFLVRGDFVGTKEFQREHNYSYFTPYMTVIPHTEAHYEHGMGALLQYLRVQSEEISSKYGKENFKSGKLYFTISKEGKIINIKLASTGGFKDLDKKMIEIMNKLEGNWTPARDAKNKVVEQTLVVAFGVLGC